MPTAKTPPKLPSAAELAKLTAGKTKAQITARAAAQRNASAARESEIGYWLKKMRKTLIEEGPKNAADGINYVTVLDIHGDYTQEGSGDARDRNDQVREPGLEEAWKRLQVEAKAQGYTGFSRRGWTEHNYSYDTMYMGHTAFDVSWPKSKVRRPVVKPAAKPAAKPVAKPVVKR